MSDKKPNSKVLDNLQSDNSELVTNTIKELRESGNSGYVPILIELLHASDNPEIKQKIISLLSDLKHSDAIPKIVDAIQNIKYASELRDLVATCWENGLDFSQHLNLFVDLVIKEEFLVAFEAFTVIENMSGKIDDAEKAKQVKKIQQALKSTTEAKVMLLEDLIHIIPVITEKKKELQ